MLLSALLLLLFIFIFAFGDGDGVMRAGAVDFSFGDMTIPGNAKPFATCVGTGAAGASSGDPPELEFPGSPRGDGGCRAGGAGGLLYTQREQGSIKNT